MEGEMDLHYKYFQMENTIMGTLRKICLKVKASYSGTKRNTFLESSSWARNSWAGFKER